jgi:hypothetical protein
MLVPGLQPNVSSVFLSEFRLFLSGYLVHLAASCRPSAAAYCAANDGPGSAAQDCAAYRVLRGRILQRHRKRNGQKS